MPADLPYALSVATLLGGPSVVTALVSEALDDPRLRPLSLTEARMAASEAQIDIAGPYVRARIYWGGPSLGYATPDALGTAIRNALAAKGVDVHVALMESDGRGETMLDFRAGRNAFGPFPVAEAARHVVPAAEAARLAYAARPDRQTY